MLLNISFSQDSKMSEDDLKQSLLPLIKILKFLGMWPTNGLNPILYWTFTFFLIIFLQIPIATLPLVDLFAKENVGVLKVASCIFLNLQISIVPFKTIFVLIFHKNLREAVEILYSKSFNSYGQEHEHIIQEDVISMKKNFNYIRLCLGTGILISSSALVKLKERRLFIEMWVPFDPKANLFNYFTVYFFSVIGKCHQ